MNIYHGSDSLKKGKIPDPYFNKDDVFDFNGSFFTTNKNFAKEFGEEIHRFKLKNKELIFDFRNSIHLKKIKTKIKIRPDQFFNGLPIATSRKSDTEYLQKIKLEIKKMGFKGWILSEYEFGDHFESIECWDLSIISLK